MTDLPTNAFVLSLWVVLWIAGLGLSQLSIWLCQDFLDGRRKYWG